jgi:hypothetical protein
VGKYCRAGRATDDNMAHGHYMMDTEGYRHTLRICNTYCFSTATVMTMETLASFHMLVLTFTYLRPFGNMPNQHMSDDLSHLQGCSTAALQPRLYNQRMHVSALSPL